MCIVLFNPHIIDVKKQTNLIEFFLIIFSTWCPKTSAGAEQNKLDNDICRSRKTEIGKLNKDQFKIQKHQFQENKVSKIGQNINCQRHNICTNNIVKEKNQFDEKQTQINLQPVLGKNNFTHFEWAKN